MFYVQHVMKCYRTGFLNGPMLQASVSDRKRHHDHTNYGKLMQNIPNSRLTRVRFGQLLKSFDRSQHWNKPLGETESCCALHPALSHRFAPAILNMFSSVNATNID